MKLTTMQNTLIIFFMGSSCIFALLFFLVQKQNARPTAGTAPNDAAAFRVRAELENSPVRESIRPEDSDSKTVWVNSGALYYGDDTEGHTLLGDLPAYSRWRIVYNATNPLDTDNGYHPQNIFRLITREKNLDTSQQFYFMVVNDNLSQSPNRNESNGIFAISRYMDSNNLYYAGVRVDGTAVLKKKVNGTYHTIAQVPFFEGDAYDKNIHPSLIPKSKWIGLRVDVENISPDTVRIKLFIDRENSGTWKKIVEARDMKSRDVPPILHEGHNGIRTDFMDVRIRNQAVLAI